MEILPDIRARDGLIDVAVHVDQDNPDIIFAVEYWENPSDHKAYMGWRVEHGDFDKLMPAFAGPPEIGCYYLIDD